MRINKFRSSLEKQIIILAIFIIMIVLIFSGFSFYNILYKSIEETIEKRALQMSHLLAKLPSVRNTLVNGEDQQQLQLVYEEFLEESSEKIFLVLIDQEGIRYTHPNRELIGGTITGNDIKRALNGEAYVSQARGISGTSIRTFVPVIDPITNEQIGVISVGFLRENLIGYVKNYVDSIFIWLGVALAIGIFASVLLAKKIKKSLYGYEPDEIARLFSEKKAMLESIEDGIIAIDQENKITLMNPSAQRILNLPDNLVGKKMNESLKNVSSFIISNSIKQGDSIELFVNNVTILARYFPIVRENVRIGTIMTFRDITEVRQIAEKLTGVQQYIDGLRAKSHEFMNKLQTIAGLVELQQYDEVKMYIGETTSKQQDLLHFLNRNIKEPKISGLLLGKVQQAEELNIKTIFTPGSKFTALPTHNMVDSLVLIIGNLFQNAIDAVKDEKHPEIHITILDQEKGLTIIVEDNGKGISEDHIDLVFKKGFSTKGESNGYGLHLVKYHVENLLEGNLYLDSAPEEGSAFIVEIPKKASRARGIS
ncbi:ATP-binding protein [Bacillus sp. Marseille-P3661]|uniref:ATP-binding protein n=1 Tax=Bacillus sp. Marseille-P3661 TaxID=1936234 RepID=UPI000C854FE1|nr:sensor histidine kinase [Bacillus sp. Marseille-P3661]